ncbi:MAG: divalent metal cation transporter [Akkermansiaceae bacterium]|nr:divalent metal cation transporter [Akkermansiaceae bacterium]
MKESKDELAQIEEASRKGPLGKAAIYTKLSGPGWLQSAITLGGGSLAGALYLGVIAGYGLMWLQPLAMICGIIMLSAIAYVTLSTGRKPLRQINTHLSPLLGWSWVVATIMANMVWAMPQFALATAAIQQNLFSERIPTSTIVILLFATALFVNHLYQSGGRGAKAFDIIIKLMVGLIVISFFAVVITLTTSGNINWGEIFGGFAPNFSLLFKPAAGFADIIASSSDPTFWKEYIADVQRDRIMTAFGTAVGINMTWLLPYSLLKKRWGKKHRGLSIFDLSIGLFIPFFLATTCVVIAAASSFHLKTGDLDPGAGAATLQEIPAIEQSIGEFKKQNPGDEKGLELLIASSTKALPVADHKLADMLVGRDANSLAITLEPFAGETVSQKIFGIGVLGMALSSIIILMLMNGVAFQEVFGGKDYQPGEKDSASKTKKLFFIGCGVSGLAGGCFELLWSGQSRAALAIPTSVIGGSLIPIAYFTFLLMMNSKKILGDSRPTGRKRLLWNVLMAAATVIASFGSVWVLIGKANFDKWKGMTPDSWLSVIPVVGLFILVVLFVVGTLTFIAKERKAD